VDFYYEIQTLPSPFSGCDREGEITEVAYVISAYLYLDPHQTPPPPSPVAVRKGLYPPLPSPSTNPPTSPSFFHSRLLYRVCTIMIGTPPSGQVVIGGRFSGSRTSYVQWFEAWAFPGALGPLPPMANEVIPSPLFFLRFSCFFCARSRMMDSLRGTCRLAFFAARPRINQFFVRSTSFFLALHLAERKTLRLRYSATCVCVCMRGLLVPS